MTPADPNAPLAALTDAVRSSPKYATLTPDFVRAVGARELAKGLRLKEAVKATRNKLHQVAGAYLDKPPDYAAWLVALREAEPEARRAVCARLMQAHASTRERLPGLSDFYTTLLAAVTERIGPVASVLDVACGLNPLAVPWMALPAGAAYHAYDVYDDLAAFFTEALPLLGVAGAGYAADVTQTVPATPVDLALVIKAIPCLQQLDRTAGARLLHGLNARCLIVSYPAASLGGRDKGMRTTYAAQFAALTADTGWSIIRYDFPNELAFVVQKP